ASPRDTHPTACPPANAHHRRRLSDTPHTTRNPTAGAAIHASTNRPASPGDNHVANPRTPTGSAKHVPIRTTTTSTPNRWGYNAPNDSTAAFDQPETVSGHPGT